MIYCQSILPRTGLGNRLFPWARCRVFSHMHGIPMLAPDWAQLKIGPLLRRESDPRFYHDLFKPGEHEISGINKLGIRLFAPKVREPENLAAFVRNAAHDRTVVIFSGFKDRFLKLNGWGRFLRKELRAITRERCLKRADERTDLPAIGIHVRRGDFVPPGSPDDFIYKGLIRTPLSWFIEVLCVIREAAASPVRAFVVSDGTEAELKDLLAVKGVTLLKTGYAISDLMLLSRARLFIASGGSSFSAWASFLGQMPTVAHPGQSLEWFKIKPRDGCYIGEFDPLSPPEEFMRHIPAIHH